jgi:molecular chaperone GrpE (heat shock protein)
MDASTVKLLIALLPVVENMGKAIIAATGRSQDEIDRMTLFQIKEMLEQTHVENWPEFEFDSPRKDS